LALKLNAFAGHGDWRGWGSGNVSYGRRSSWWKWWRWGRWGRNTRYYCSTLLCYLGGWWICWSLGEGVDIRGFIGDRLCPLNTVLCTIRLLMNGSSHRCQSEVFVSRIG
jgi:hypothetical protein